MTIYDIAQEAGVSIATVSRVINGGNQVSENTRKKVQLVLDRHHFVLNATAKNLATKTTRTIGIVVQSLRNIHYMDAANVVVSYFDSIGYACMLVPAHYDEDKHATAVIELATRNLDGLVLVGSFFGHSKMRDAIRNYYSEVPVLHINGDLELPNVISVKADEETGAAMATERLIQGGCKQLVYVNGRISPSSVLKKDGFIAACEKHRDEIDCSRLWKLDRYEFDEMRSSIRNMLKAFPDTDGILFCDDMIAAAGTSVIKELGLAIPERIKCISFDNCRYSIMATPKLTTVDNRICELAEIGCNLMNDYFKQETKKHMEPLVLDCTLVERQTT